MGLTIQIKGMKDTYDCGYHTFAMFRRALAKAYNPEMGELYDRWLSIPQTISDDDIARYYELSNPDLDVFLFHSDCDGKLTPKECRGIYNAIKDLEMSMPGHNYVDMVPYNMLERWKEMFKFCASHRVNMWFR